MTKRLFICYVNVVLLSLSGRFVAVLVWPFWFVAVLDVRRRKHA